MRDCSAGRKGELRENLQVPDVEGGRIGQRVGLWLLRLLFIIVCPAPLLPMVEIGAWPVEPVNCVTDGGRHHVDRWVSKVL